MGSDKDSLYMISGKYFLPTIKKQSIFPYYHLIKDNTVPHIENLYRFKNVQQFMDDIDFLKRNYKPINPKQLLSGSRPENSFLITFDDGLAEIYSIVFPILKEKGLNAIFFINPDFVDNNESLYKHDISIIIKKLKDEGFSPAHVKIITEALTISHTSESDLIQQLKSVKFSDRDRIKALLTKLDINIADYLNTQKPYVTKAQIKEMLEAGFYFGGHTRSHPPLTQLSFDEQKSEIIGSIEWLKSNFGIEYSLFAFPFSDSGISQKLMNDLFKYDENILIFGNSGIKKDIDERVIQRFSLENPDKDPVKQIVTENLYKFFNKLIGKYQIRRNG